MIAHGRKQISEMVYARKASEGGGAVRLTNMIRGPQVVFGGLRPSFKWLTDATKQAILGAFGVSDGKAVIKATNAYLTALAATDPTKAQALAGFINEDPMMVCSLVDTPKDRKIVIPNNASSTGRNNKLFIDWIKINQVGKVEMGIQRLTFTGMGLLVVLNDGNNPCCGIGYNSLNATFTPTLGDWKKVTDQTITFANSSTGRLSFFLYGSGDTNWTNDAGCTYIKVYARDNTTLLLHLVPFKRDGKMYFLDLLATDDQTRTLLYSTTGSASPYEQITDKGSSAPYP